MESGEWYLSRRFSKLKVDEHKLYLSMLYKFENETSATNNNESMIKRNRISEIQIVEAVDDTTKFSTL